MTSAATRNGPPGNSVANVSRIVSIDQTLLEERTGRLTASELHLLLAGIDLVLGRG